MCHWTACHGMDCGTRVWCRECNILMFMLAVIHWLLCPRCRVQFLQRQFSYLKIFFFLFFFFLLLFFFQAEDGIRDSPVTGVQTCALPISKSLGDAREVSRGRAGSPSEASATHIRDARKIARRRARRCARSPNHSDMRAGMAAKDRKSVV